MIIDLCSGLGTWSDEAIRIDIDRKVKPTIQADVRFLPLRPHLRPKLCHASPPCKYISKARRWRWGWNPLGIAESFELAASCYRAFDYIEAETSTFEWPKAIEEMMGTKVTIKYRKLDIKEAKTNFYSDNRSLRRALIPPEIKKGLETL